MSGPEVLIFLALLALLAYWMRGYASAIRRSARSARAFFQVARTAFNGGPRVPRRNMRVVDVTSRARTTCPLCGDQLSTAQIDALRARSIQCPGSKRLGQPCPFRKVNDLN